MSALEIAPDVWRIALPLPPLPGAERLRVVNTYLVGGERWCLIDTGMDHADGLDALSASLTAAGRRVEDIEIILISHHHPDHWGMSGRLRELTGASVLMHRDDIDVYLGRLFGGFFTGSDPATFISTNGGPQVDASALFSQLAGAGFRPATPDRLLADGDRIDLGGRALEVIHTPGHAPGHCCFALEGEDVVLTADHVLPTITPHVGAFPGGPANPLQDFLGSLQRIAERGFALALPGHGDPITRPQERIGDIERHHKERLRATVDALDPHRETAWDLLPVIFGELPPIHRVTAMFETLAHLALAETRGLVRQREVDGRIIWSPTP